jgi:hypothetical protein
MTRPAWKVAENALHRTYFRIKIRENPASASVFEARFRGGVLAVLGKPPQYGRSEKRANPKDRQGATPCPFFIYPQYFFL